MVPGHILLCMNWECAGEPCARHACITLKLTNLGGARGRRGDQACTGCYITAAHMQAVHGVDAVA